MFKVDNEFKGANISRTVRFPEKIFKQLNRVAQENEVSFNLLILQCCKFALSSMDEEEE